MAVSINDLVQRVRDLLNDDPYTTTTTTTGTGATVTVGDSSLWTEGDVLEFQTGTVGFEQAYVTAVPGAGDLTTSRGYRGTTAEGHTSGDRVYQNPAYYGRQIQQALLQAAKALWPHVFKVGTISITPSAARWENLNANTLGIVRVYQVFNGTDLGRYGGRGQKRVEVDFVLPTAIVASGKGIRFVDGYYDTANAVTVTDMRAVTGSSDIEDSEFFNVADSLVWTAAGILVGAGEIARVSSGSDLETVSNVGTGSRLQTGNYYLTEGKRKLEELALKYKRHYQPLRMVEVP